MPRTAQALRKVPEASAFFWVTKVLTTAMGEATSDYLVAALPRVLAVAMAGLVLVAVLIWQFRAPRYVPWIYWSTVVMVAVFGTMAADVVHIQFGIPYAVSTPFFACVLAACFLVWYRSEKTLSIHSIDTPLREAFYWATIMSTFALGTALGDLTATTMHLGYFASGVMFAVLIAMPALAYRYLHINGILAFWAAYVLTRPLGASFADWGGKAHSAGGLGLGDGVVSLGLTVVIVILVGYQAIMRGDDTEELQSAQ